MSQIATDHPANLPAPGATALSDHDWQHRLDAIARDPRMSPDNIRANGTVGKLGIPLLLIGAAGLLLTVIGAASVNLRHALAAFEIGVFTALAMSLGSIFFLLVFHSLNAGWVITCRRVFENIASVVWFPWLLMVVVAMIEWQNGGVLLEWMGGDHGDYLLSKKTPYLNPGFFFLRLAIYGAVWIFLGRRFAALSRLCDETGDRTLGRRARFSAGWGILLFALTTAFAAFDFLMSMDYRFFSTMWGVYYFASCALSSVSMVVLVLAVLRSRGKLAGLVTEEHFHDLGKLMFAFTVFWTYISFSQYFLIWYSNIPEETAWFVYRKSDGWMWLFQALIVGHFIVPFLVIIWRGIKRSTFLLGVMALFMIVMTIADIGWIIRPMVYTPAVTVSGGVEDPGLPGLWLDAAGVLGVLGVWGFLLTRAIEKGNLLPTKDPMLHESMKHMNYV